RRSGAHVVGHLLDLGPAGGPSRDARGNGGGGAIRVRHGAAAPHPGKCRREARSPRSRRSAARGHRVGERPHGVAALSGGPLRDRLTAALEWGVIPAVPVPFRGDTLAEDALQAYTSRMAALQVGGVSAVPHTA